MHVGIGEDSTAAPVATAQIGGQQMSQANVPFTNSITLSRVPANGYHFYAWLERVTASGTTTWYGDQGGGSIYQTGLAGTIVN